MRGNEVVCFTFNDEKITIFKEIAYGTRYVTYQKRSGQILAQKI